MNLGIPMLDKIPARELVMKFQALWPDGRHTDILKRLDASLLLYDKSLVNISNGEVRDIHPGEDESFANALAQVAKQLLLNHEEKLNILLLLPTADFVATSYSMSITSEKLVRSALELQSHSLIPAYDENLLLAVNARNQEGVALWFNENEANQLFSAFDRCGLFLCAIMPRSLGLLDRDSEEEKTILINDEEGSNISFLQAQGTAIRKLLTVNRTDLEQEVFAKQWDIETSQLKGEAIKNMVTLDDWKGLLGSIQAVPEYCFLPSGAVEEEKRINFVRRSKIAGVIAVCFVLLLFAPFISNWMALNQLQDDLEIAQEQSLEPRNLQASIFNMEQEWGALDEYPDQNVAETLVSLNDVIQSSLTSFTINEGIVDITGSTNDPAFLVELLAEKEEFYNVGQSTNTRGGGSQFGIRMNLSSVDFEAYEEKYPAINQGR